SCTTERSWLRERRRRSRPTSGWSRPISVRSSSLLTLDRVSAGYRRLQVLHDVSMRVEHGEIVALIGANGAGKTTLLRAISGLLGVTGGGITFEGERIDGMRPERIVRLGLVHVPEGRALFGPLTVMENLHMGAYT